MTDMILIIFPSIVLIFFLLAKILNSVFIISQESKNNRKKETNQTIVNKIGQIITKGIKKECNINKINSKELKAKREEAKEILFMIEISIVVVIVTIFLIIGEGSGAAFSAGLAVSALILFVFSLYNKELVNYYLCKEYGKTFVLKKQNVLHQKTSD